MTSETQLCYDCTQSNLVDFLSKYVSTSRFRDILQWWEGLEWLLEEDKWLTDIIRGNDRKDEIVVLIHEESKNENI